MISIIAHKTNQDKIPQDRTVLWLRIGALLVGIIASVLFLISFLNYSNYRKTFLELNLNRYLVMAKDVRQTIVLGLNVGLKPAENTHLPPIMKDMIQRQSGIRYIGIVDESGEAITQGQVAAKTVAEWKTWINKTAAEDSWHTSDADTFQIGVPFLNNFNVKVGAVVIGYDKHVIEGAINDMGRTLLLDVLATLSFFTVITFAGVYLLTRKFVGKIAAIGQAIDSTLIAIEPTEVGDDMLDSGVAKDINDFTASSQQLVSTIAKLERAILPSHHKNVEAT
ncbi:hypothetical protein [Solimicrobium silvestre]|uniref:HAMP domain-containing protein n=1 Tax=Solimicrobium silvestre TaxID=2099400 RepID=A0A2S9GYK0_9BURK|nr:hypothetical protein [Solimicrobium silvestre]PRC92791.1 hypothetical protein S2091_2521 [Solimicrobium silvestre]